MATLTLNAGEVLSNAFGWGIYYTRILLLIYDPNAVTCRGLRKGRSSHFLSHKEPSHCSRLYFSSSAFRIFIGIDGFPLAC